jgi:hypothetical protein
VCYHYINSQRSNVLTVFCLETVHEQWYECNDEVSSCCFRRILNRCSWYWFCCFMLNLTLTNLLFLVSVSICRLGMFNKGSLKIFTLCKIVNWLQYFSFQLIFCPLFLEVYAIVFIFCCLKVIIIHNIFGCKELHCNFFFCKNINYTWLLVKCF